jgi:hypothetical protein
MRCRGLFAVVTVIDLGKNSVKGSRPLFDLCSVLYFVGDKVGHNSGASVKRQLAELDVLGEKKRSSCRACSCRVVDPSQLSGGVRPSAWWRHSAAALAGKPDRASYPRGTFPCNTLRICRRFLVVVLIFCLLGDMVTKRTSLGLDSQYHLTQLVAFLLCLILDCPNGSRKSALPA